MTYGSALASGYRVDRSQDLGLSWTTVGTPLGTSWDDTGGLLGLTVVYRVVAVRGAWRSAPSATSGARVVNGLGVCL